MTDHDLAAERGRAPCWIHRTQTTEQLVQPVPLRRSLCPHQLNPLLRMHTDPQVVHVAYIDERLLHAVEQLMFPLPTQLNQWNRETSERKLRPFAIQTAL